MLAKSPFGKTAFLIICLLNFLISFLFISNFLDLQATEIDPADAGILSTDTQSIAWQAPAGFSKSSEDHRYLFLLHPSEQRLLVVDKTRVFTADAGHLSSAGLQEGMASESAETTSSSWTEYDLASLVPEAARLQDIAVYRRGDMLYIYLSAHWLGPRRADETTFVLPVITLERERQLSAAEKFQHQRLKVLMNAVGQDGQGDPTAGSDHRPAGRWVLTSPSPAPILGDGDIALVRDPKALHAGASGQPTLVSLDTRRGVVHTYDLEDPYHPSFRTSLAVPKHLHLEKVLSGQISSPGSITLPSQTDEHSDDSDSLPRLQKSLKMKSYMHGQGYAFTITTSRQDSTENTQPSSDRTTHLSLLNMYTEQSRLTGLTRAKLYEDVLGHAWLKGMLAFGQLAGLVDVIDDWIDSSERPLDTLAEAYPEIGAAIAGLDARAYIDWAESHHLISEEESVFFRTTLVQKSHDGYKWFIMAAAASALFEGQALLKSGRWLAQLQALAQRTLSLLETAAQRMGVPPSHVDAIKNRFHRLLPGLKRRFVTQHRLQQRRSFLLKKRVDQDSLTLLKQLADPTQASDIQKRGRWWKSLHKRLKGSDKHQLYASLRKTRKLAYQAQRSYQRSIDAEDLTHLPRWVHRHVPKQQVQALEGLYERGLAHVPQLGRLSRKEGLKRLKLQVEQNAQLLDELTRYYQKTEAMRRQVKSVYGGAPLGRLHKAVRGRAARGYGHLSAEVSDAFLPFVSAPYDAEAALIASRTDFAKITGFQDELERFIRLQKKGRPADRHEMAFLRKDIEDELSRVRDALETTGHSQTIEVPSFDSLLYRHRQQPKQLRHQLLELQEQAAKSQAKINIMQRLRSMGADVEMLNQAADKAAQFHLIHDPSTRALLERLTDQFPDDKATFRSLLDSIDRLSQASQAQTSGASTQRTERLIANLELLFTNPSAAQAKSIDPRQVLKDLAQADIIRANSPHWQEAKTLSESVHAILSLKLDDLRQATAQGDRANTLSSLKADVAELRSRLFLARRSGLGEGVDHRAKTVHRLARGNDDSKAFYKNLENLVDEQLNHISAVGRAAKVTTDPFTQAIIDVTEAYASWGMDINAMARHVKRGEELSHLKTVAEKKAAYQHRRGGYRLVQLQAALAENQLTQVFGGTYRGPDGGIHSARVGPKHVLGAYVAGTGELILDSANRLKQLEAGSNETKGWGDSPQHFATPEWVPFIGGTGPFWEIGFDVFQNVILTWALTGPMMLATNDLDAFETLIRGKGTMVGMQSKPDHLMLNFQRIVKGHHPMNLFRDRVIMDYLPKEAFSRLIIAQYKLRYAEDLQTPEGQERFEDFVESIKRRTDLKSYLESHMFTLLVDRWGVHMQYVISEDIKALMRYTTGLKYTPETIINAMVLPYTSAFPMRWQKTLLGEHHKKLSEYLRFHGAGDLLATIEHDGYADLDSWTHAQKLRFLKIMLHLEMLAMHKEIPLPSHDQPEQRAAWLNLFKQRVFGGEEYIKELLHRHQDPSGELVLGRVQLSLPANATTAEPTPFLAAAIDEEWHQLKAGYEHFRFLPAKHSREVLALGDREATPAEVERHTGLLLKEATTVNQMLLRSLNDLSANRNALEAWNSAGVRMGSVEAMSVFYGFMVHPFVRQLWQTKHNQTPLTQVTWQKKMPWLSQRLKDIGQSFPRVRALKDAMQAPGWFHRFQRASQAVLRRQSTIALFLTSVGGAIYFDHQKEAHVSAHAALAQMLAELQQFQLQVTEALLHAHRVQLLQSAITTRPSSMTQTTMSEVEQTVKALEDYRKQTVERLDLIRDRFEVAYQEAKERDYDKGSRWSVIGTEYGPYLMMMSGGYWVGSRALRGLLRERSISGRIGKSALLPGLGPRGAFVVDRVFQFMFVSGLSSLIAGTAFETAIEGSLVTYAAEFLALYAIYSDANFELHLIDIWLEHLRRDLNRWEAGSDHLPLHFLNGEAMRLDLHALAQKRLQGDALLNDRSVIKFRKYLICLNHPQLTLCSQTAQ